MADITEEIQTAVYGVELDESEAQTLAEKYPNAISDMLALDIDVTSDDATGHNYSSGYRHSLGVVMGDSGYADVAKLALKPPSKFGKKFESQFSAMLADIGVRRRARGILVTQQRRPS